MCEDIFGCNRYYNNSELALYFFDIALSLILDSYKSSQPGGTRFEILRTANCKPGKQSGPHEEFPSNPTSREETGKKP